eukprot:CAMPEP_0172514982 /NCGR_PEP_ID=MMETSP1066-20121228/264427_1 /TAXON_ID=671091 /ORGANISM="Coscinodiscus wailesii, Strain CCMP2513" /LENGTH=349 /DNA_ID=CAMNT_0013295867 /DNA_START=52 /DNA_END=1098 /DNA_ORIENTATION=+
MGCSPSKQAVSQKQSTINDLQIQVNALQHTIEKIQHQNEASNSATPIVTASAVEVVGDDSNINGSKSLDKKVSSSYPPPSAPPPPLGSIYTISDNLHSKLSSVNSLSVIANFHPDAVLEKGKYCILASSDLIPSCFAHVGWTSTGKPFEMLNSSANIKGNEGTVLRARNERNKQEGGLILWPNEQHMYGCWNPTEYAKDSDWEVGDIVTLLDFPVDGVIAKASSYQRITGTGWNIGGDCIQFGKCGLVGDWWKEMEVEFKFDEICPLIGVHTDSVLLPYSIKYQDCTGNWIVLKDQCLGSVIDPDMFAKAKATHWRLHWQSTDLHKTSGLSTYRSGGGLHAEFLCSRET